MACKGSGVRSSSAPLKFSDKENLSGTTRALSGTTSAVANEVPSHCLQRADNIRPLYFRGQYIYY